MIDHKMCCMCCHKECREGKDVCDSCLGDETIQLDRIEAKLDLLLASLGAPLQGGTEGFDEVMKSWGIIK